MTIVSIPNWTAQGVLPPNDVVNPMSATRSPYRVSLTDFVLRFGTSCEREAIIDGLLRYRAALHAVGLTTGFQWVDGSFMEQVEVLESRPPNDVDVVTLYHIPAGETQESIWAKNTDLFHQDHVKAQYQVDAYVLHLGGSTDQLVKQSAYWYSLWSHRRNQAWKGFLEIGLDGSHDLAAAQLLATRQGTGGTP